MTSSPRQRLLFGFEKRASNAPMSPAGTLCFDIFSPPPGDNDVISQIERLSSIETKIAPRSLRMALGASSRLAIPCMVSPEWVVATSLCQSVGRYPPPHGISNDEPASVLHARVAHMFADKPSARGRGRRSESASGLIEQTPYNAPDGWSWDSHGRVGRDEYWITCAGPNPNESGIPVLRSEQPFRLARSS